ncbi:DUF3019 domain-containing protein [Corallincola platygyrae]|uniref:DUF3019 domain-containing protein n=2 Tax=Corallincola platygyrae TaxID=1193278 RepID=A0ABW4XK21_9GAMM
MTWRLLTCALTMLLSGYCIGADAPEQPNTLDIPTFISKNQSAATVPLLLKPSELVNYLRVRYAYQPIDVAIDQGLMTLAWKNVAPEYVVVNRPKGRALHDRSFWQSVLTNYKDSSIRETQFTIENYTQYANSNFEVIAINQINDRPRFTVIGQVTIPSQAEVLAETGMIVSPTVIDAELENSPILSATPDKCVVQSKGEPCRASISLTWQLDTPQNVCLYLGRRYRPLQCWENQTSDVFSYEFDSTQTLNFWLSRMPDRRRLAEKRISVVWVYEQQKKPRRWRIF